MGRKNKDLQFNIDNKTSEYGNIETNFYSEDENNASIRFKLTYKNTSIDLIETGLTPKFDLFHSDGSIWLNESLIIIDPTHSIFQWNIPNNIIAHYGEIDAKLFLVGEGQSIHVANFSFNIEDSGIDSAIGKEIDIPMLEDIVKGLLEDGTVNLLNDELKDELFNNVNQFMTDNNELFKGEDGIDGLQGEQGPQGIQGIQGPKGADGSNGANVSTHVTLTLLNGITAYVDYRKPVYKVIDFGQAQIISVGGMITNVPVNATTSVAATPFRPYADYFIPTNDSSVTLKMSTGGTLTVQTTTNWSTGRALTFNGNVII